MEFEVQRFEDEKKSSISVPFRNLWRMGMHNLNAALKDLSYRNQH
jgi:hypothetical protein